MENILSNYPDIMSNAIIPMIIGVFALAFPLLIQTITRIDDKYNSTELIEVFRKDFICKWFLVTLVIAIISYIVWILQLPPLVNWGWIIDNSALIFATFSTVILIIMTFGIVYLTYIYYIPKKLLNHLISKYLKIKKENRKKEYLHAISKLLNYSIETIDESLPEKLWEFYFSEFMKFRKNKAHKEITYKKEYYDTFLEANEILCEKNKRAISRFNNNSIFDLFLDGYQQTIISQDTYSFLWKIIIQSLHYEREDFVISYWRKAHQLLNLFMPIIYPTYDCNRITNQIEIDNRNKERSDFLEFHYALGGLLLYKQKYNALREIMNFTQSWSPIYVLVPESMHQVIERYMKLNEYEYLNPVYYMQKYQFPDIYGVNADDTIKMWIKKYLALLFIRQYTLPEYNVNSNRLTMPTPPNQLLELKHWNEELNSLLFFVNDYLSKKEILKELNFEQIANPDWFDKNKKIEPSVLIENYKKKIEEEIEGIKKNQTVAENKKNEFIEKTKNLLTPIFKKYKNVFNNGGIGNNYQSYFISGQGQILPKGAFSNNQDIEYTDYDSSTAQIVLRNFQYNILNFLISINPQKYFLTDKNLFGAIDKLNINSNHFVIIAVCLNIEYYCSSLQIKGLKKEDNKWLYNNMEIVELGNYVNELVSQSIFILKKEDLPKIIFNEVGQGTVKKYHLQKIDKDFNIFGKINDLNETENSELKDEIEKQNSQVDLSQQVLVYVGINVKVQYKPKVKCIQLKTFSQFDDRGSVNTIDDVKNIWTI